ncbi:hypothetical protein [Mycobacteroides abscessus]|uniref:hypothetical protein n=1 Tax=unclassified Desemzia TaxID=2685243 RepID=UPI0009D186C8|nr:Uncharacterised protein [Mycobacteroides abscessus subsp. abscessus]
MDFKQAKQKKERGYSVNELVDELVETKDTYEQVIIVAINKDKEVDISFSTEETSSVIGLLEVVKSILVDEIRG